MFAEALEEEGINTKMREKSNQDLNKKLWESGCSFLHCRKDTGQRMQQTILCQCSHALQELFFIIIFAKISIL